MFKLLLQKSGLTVIGISMCLLLIIKVVHIKQNQDRVIQNQQTVTTLKPAAVLDAHDIVHWHLFGTAPITADHYPISALPLKLLGILASDNKQQALAIIETPSETAKVYGLQETLPLGAKVQHILPNAVIILHNGELSQLPLELYSEEP